MVIDKNLMDNLTEQAKMSPRLRMNLDLRNSPEDQSQRMMNALEPGTIVNIHRHEDTSEVVSVIRGSLVEYFYDENHNVIETIRAAAGSDVPAFVVPKGMLHNCESLESGTVIIECKDGAYKG